MKSLALQVSLLVCMAVAACGGGGGGNRAVLPQNTPPTADAGPDQAAAENSSVTLAGQGADADGDALTYAWSQVSGAPVTFADVSDPATTVELPTVAIGAAEDIVLSLRVTDTSGSSATDEITVSVSSTDYVVFIAGAAELFKFDPETGQTRQLSTPVASSGQVRDFRISPDAQWVSYLATLDSNQFELFVVAADGGAAVKVNAPLQVSGNVREFRWSPDSTQLAYLADAEIDNVEEVYLVNVDGSDHRKISGFVGGPPAAVELWGIRWSPDGRYISQRVRRLSDNRFEGINVYDTQAGVPNSTRLNPPLVIGGRIEHDEWAPDGSRLLYVGRTESVDAREIFSVRPDGSGHVKINPTLTNGASIARFPEWSPDSGQILFAADSNADGNADLYVAEADGSSATRINQDGESALVFLWSTDAEWITFLRQSASAVEWINARPDGSDLITLPNVSPSNIFWSPDGQRIAYLQRSPSNNQFQLFAANFDGSGELQLNSTVPMNGQVFNLRWSPDSSRLVYVANTSGGLNLDYYTVRVDASEDIRLNEPFLSDIVQLGEPLPMWSADGSRLIYRGPQDSPQVFDLYLASPDGVANVRLTATPETAGSVPRFAFSP